MQRCPACHHKFMDEDYLCDLCGLSLEAVVARENGSFTSSLLSLASRLNVFTKKAPEAEVTAEQVSAEQLVQVRR